MVDKTTLSASSRSNLLSLQRTAGMIATTQNRLSTGLAVSSAMDDAVKYFQAKSLNSRAQDLGERKDAIDQGVSTLDATLKATDAMENLVSRMKGLVEASRSQTVAQRTETAKQLTELHNQVAHLVEDATYKGLNLLNNASAKLTVRFSDKADSKLEVDGVDFTAKKYLLKEDLANPGQFIGADVDVGDDVATGIGFTKALDAYDFTDSTDLATYSDDANNAIVALEATIDNIRAKSSVVATNADILKVRLDFTKDYVSVLQAGADKLTLADLNEEGANLLALQTRQQIGIQALSFAGQSEQSVLSLFR